MTPDLDLKAAREARLLTIERAIREWDGHPNLQANLRETARQIRAGDSDGQLTELLDAIRIRREMEAAPEPKEPPKDGTVIHAFVRVSMRWAPYKPNSVQAWYGQKGRWQECGPHGGWQNSQYEPEKLRWEIAQ